MSFLVCCSAARPDRPFCIQKLTSLGATLGSAQIDHAFEVSVRERLEVANKVALLNIDIDDTAWEMMKSKEYQNAKCDYGAPDDTEYFSVAIPKLSRSYSVEYLGIVDGEIRIRRFL